MTYRPRMPRLGAVSITLIAAATIGTGVSAVAATDVSPAQAAALEIRVREGVTGLLGPSVKLSDRPVQIKAAGDHFDVVVPTASDALDGSGKVRITATARPETDGAWAVENIKVTSPLRFIYNMPAPTGEGPASRTSVPVVTTLNVEGQDGRIFWDPSFATPSTWSASNTGMTIHTEAGLVSQETKVGPSNSVTTLRPVGLDRADLLVDGSLQDYDVDSLMSDSPMHIAMQRIRVTSALNGVSRSRAATLIQAFIGIVLPLATSQNGEPPAAAPKIAPELIHSALEAFQDFASEFKLDETIDGFAMKMQDQAVGVERFVVGLSAHSDGGLLQAGMDLGIDGLALPNMTLGDMSVLVPRKIELHPVVSGLGVAELLRIANAAVDELDPAAADIAALFSHGGLVAGLENVKIDVAGTVFSGQGQVRASGPSADLVGGTAQITADHFDDLVQKLSAMPALAPILPAIVFAKGVGRSMGDRLVWDLSYKQGKLLVNNVDLSAMMGGGGPVGITPDHGSTVGPPKAASPRSQPRKPAPNWGK